MTNIETAQDPSVAFLRKIRQDIPDISYKNLLRLVGHDFQRQQTINNSLLLFDVMNAENEETFNRSLNALSKITRQQAFRMLQMFPSAAMRRHQINADDPRLGKIEWSFVGTSFFLLQKELEIPALRALQTSRLKIYEKYAALCERRYLLIREVLNYHSLEAFKPSFMWLLSEACICYREMVNINVPTPKPAFYELQKNKIKYLDDLIAEGSRAKKPAIKLPELSTDVIGSHNIDLCFLEAAVFVARESPEFEGEYFQPFLKAWTSWNNYSLKGETGKQFLMATKKRRGRVAQDKPRK